MTYNIFKKILNKSLSEKKQIKKYFGDRFICFLNGKDKKYISFIVKDRIK